MEILIANNAESTLAADLAAAGVSMTIQTADGSKFPTLSGSKRFRVTVTRKNTGAKEVMLVATHTAGSATLAGLTRAQEGTSALDFVAGDIVSIRPTAALLDEMRSITRQNPSNVASASPVTLSPTYGYHRVTGAVSVDLIDSTNVNGGQRLLLLFVNGLTVVHGRGSVGANKTIKLRTGANQAYPAGTTLELVYDETDSAWYEV